jgi:hypothetical protein
MKSNLTLCMFALVLFSASCNQDSIIEPEDCLKSYLAEDTLVSVVLPTQCPSTVASHYPELFTLDKAVFNPTNGNQLIFIVSSTVNINQFHELYVFDACAGTINKIGNQGMRLNSLDWSSNGWIYFSEAQSGIWKVQPDGSQLQQIVSLVPIGEVTCSPDGNEIIYFGEYLATADGVLINQLGVAADTTYFTWLSNRDYAAVVMDENRLVRLDSNLSVVETIDQLTNEAWGFGGQSPVYDQINQRIYWIAMNKLAYNQFPSNQRTEFDNALSSRDYSSVDVSGDGKRVVFTRVDRVVIDDCHEDLYLGAYIVGKDGGQVSRLNIPF